MVQHHRHVTAEVFLNLHRPLRRQFQQAAVDVRTERGPLLGHLRHLRQAEELKSAAVGENRPFPSHKPIQTS